MLLKLNIPNKIFKQKIISKMIKTDSINFIYTIRLESLAAKRKFIREIFTNSPHKKNILFNIDKLKDGHAIDYHYYAGLHYKEYIRKVRRLIKVGGNLHRILSSNIPMTRGLYRKCSTMAKLPSLDNLIIEKIISIESIKGPGYVYDMTIPETHNFLIETGFVSSNCHDFGLELGTQAHMAELVRTKAGPFNYHQWVTLHDLKDAYDIWKESKDETLLRKAIQPVELAVNHLPKVWIFDNAIDTVCNGALLSLPGIVKLESNIEANDLVAVMSLKNELVCLGIVNMNSEMMLTAHKGVAVTETKVFMKPGTYPKFKKEALNEKEAA